MLLRTSSAPVLSSLNSSFAQTEVCKDSVEPPHNVHSSHLSSFHSVPSPSSHPGRTSRGICAGEDVHTKLGTDQELGHISRPPSLSRAQSEGDLTCFPVAMGFPDQGMSGFESAFQTERSRRDLRASLHTTVSPFNVQEFILEEIEEPEQFSPLPKGSNSLRHSNECDVSGHPHGFVLNDGVVYSSLKLNPSGSPIACNSKGCRPLTEPECKQLGILDMASGIGSGNFEWCCDDENISHHKEAYYQNLLQSEPENPLFLHNYAQYLIKEGEVKKAEEYFERAILVDPNDGDILSNYAKLQWDVNRDQDRAEAYHGQAVQAAPNDCYVMASYASFLWDMEDNEETNPAAPQLAAYGAMPPALSPLLASA